MTVLVWIAMSQNVNLANQRRPKRAPIILHTVNFLCPYSYHLDQLNHNSNVMIHKNQTTDCNTVLWIFQRADGQKSMMLGDNGKSVPYEIYIPKTNRAWFRLKPDVNAEKGLLVILVLHCITNAVNSKEIKWEGSVTNEATEYARTQIKPWT